jgi:hypothetical protein
MPKYNVTLYGLHWQSFPDIEAESVEAAIRVAADGDIEPTNEDDAGDTPQEALVDSLEDGGEQHFNLIWRYAEDGGTTVELIANQDNRSTRNSALAHLIALAEIDLDSGEDPALVLAQIVVLARGILGRPIIEGGCNDNAF